MREPQCFSTCLSVPGFAWLDRTDSKQASACWSVSVGGLPLRSPGESLVSSPGEQAIFPGFSRPGTHRWRPAQICDLARRPHATFAYAHSCGYAVRFAKRIAFGSPGKKATFAYAHSYACGYAWRPIPASLRAAEGPIREFPGFSRNGTHRVQPALQIALRLFGQDGKHRSASVRGGVLRDLACSGVEHRRCNILRGTTVEFQVNFFRKPTVCG